ncbi:MAG: DUF5667 domain-containing protein [Minisyncoccota bacterium]
MKSTFEQLKKERLSVYEKYVMRRALVRHIHAIPSPYGQPSPMTGVWVRSRALVISTVVGVFLISTTISYAASVALPGDVLYPVKLSINEPMKIFFARTPEAQAQAHMAIAAERLTEAEQLALRGDLSENKTVFLGGQASQNINRALATVAVLKKTDSDRADELQNKIDATINAHAIVLGAIAKQYAYNHATTSFQLAAISAQVSGGANDEAGGSPPATSVVSMGTTTEATTSVRVLVSKQDENLAQAVNQAYISARRAKAFQEIADLQAKLDGGDSEAHQRALRASGAATRGDDLLSAGDTAGALKEYARADQTAREGRQLVLLENKLKITVNAQGTQRTTEATSTATTTTDRHIDAPSIKQFPQDATSHEGVLPVPQVGGD